MHLTINTKQFDEHNVMISDKTKNNIMSNSDFYRIYFSNDFFTLNGLSIIFTLYNLTVEKYFNKIKCNFEDNINNRKEVESIKNIERNANAKIMFYELSLQIIKLLKVKRKFVEIN